MTRTLERLGLLAVLGALGIVAPVAGANAATMPAGLPVPPFPALAAPALGVPHFPTTGLAFPTTGLPPFRGPGSFVGPSVGRVAAVIGPTVITTAPSTFTNTNIQVSAGENLTGGQAGV